MFTFVKVIVSYLLLISMLQIGCESSISETVMTMTAPWSGVEPQPTLCTLNHDSNHLVFEFIVTDTSLISLNQDNFHEGIGLSDRVELFFTTDTLLSRYYGMELCYDQRILSFRGTSYRQLDYEWSWPNDALEVTCNLTSEGYACSGKFSLDYLRSLGLINEEGILMGVFRADYHDESDPHQVTWVTAKDPLLPSPDFHRPSAFVTYQIR